MVFECLAVSRFFATRSGTIHALRDVTFAAAREEFLCIVGPTGCGKSTLLRIIAGLLQPTSGKVRFAEGGPAGQLQTAMVFQEHGLYPWMSAAANAAFGLETRGVPRTERLHAARTFLAQVGLDAFARNYPHELSVGMRQQVSIARAFIANPTILLMDEPFGSVDAQTRRILQEELLRLWETHQKLVVFVTHDIEEAILLGDRILVMSERPGRILEEVPVRLERPRRLAVLQRTEAMEIRWIIWKMLEPAARSSAHTLA